MADRRIDFRFAPPSAQFLICLADDPFKTLVWEDGSLCCNFDAALEEHRLNMFAPGRKPVWSPAMQNRGFRFRCRPRFLHLDELLSQGQDYGDAHAAIVTTRQAFRHTAFEWTAFAWQEGGVRADILLWRLEALSGFHPAPSRVVLDLLGEVAGPGLPAVVTAQAEPCGLLSSGQVWEGAFYLVHQGSVDGLATLPHAKQALAWARAYWDKLTPFQLRMEIPDPKLMDMLASCGRNLLQAREVKNGLTTYQVGPTHYRGQWIADGRFMLEAALYMGRQEDALAAILGILRQAQPSGAITIMPFHEKETGIAITSLLRLCELAGDTERVQEVWPFILRAFHYIRSLRDKARDLGEGSPVYGLFPPTFGDGGIFGPEMELTTPLWMLAGLKKAAETAQELDLPGKEDILDEYHSLRETLLAAIAANRRISDTGLPYLPMSLKQEPTGYTPWTGTWALAQAIAPGEVFAPGDKVVQEFLLGLDSIDHRQGIPECTGWMNRDAVWTYAAMFYAQVFLYAGRPDKAVDYLYAFVNHASRGRCWREEQAIAGCQSDAVWGDMPHNWASAELIRLVRHLLVLERLGNLELLAGLPAEWLPGEGERLYLESTPTRWGPVTLELRRVGQGFHLRAQATFRGSPEATWLNWNGQRTRLAWGAGGVCEVTLPLWQASGQTPPPRM